MQAFDHRPACSRGQLPEHPKFACLSAANVAAAADTLLKRLETDYIDLYWAHFDDPDVGAHGVRRDAQFAGDLRTGHVTCLLGHWVGTWTVELRRR